MEQNQNKKRKRLFILGPAILLILLAGVTYSFFNYTRTGNLNNFGTGRIYFNSNQGNTLNMTNVFPMASSEAGEANLDSVTVEIVGDTTYADGEEFEITLVDVTNTINGKSIPINYIATYTATASGDTIGTSSNDYWDARYDKDASIYTLNATGQVDEGKQVLVGYIKSDDNGISGTLTIKAYIDKDRIAISDTYYENAPSPNPSASPLASPNDEYGTTTEWVNGRTVLTTDEWNSLSSTPISFKIRAESNEGIWVEEPLNTIESCPDCKFMYYVVNDSNDPLFTTWNMAGYDEVNQVEIRETPSVITEGLYDDYEELINTTGKNYFLGVKLNGSNQVTNAYACGVKNDVPFCIEGTLYLGLGGTQNATTYSTNQTLLQGANLYNNTCNVVQQTGYEYTECGLWDNSSSLSAGADSDGTVSAGVGRNDGCDVSTYGYFGCDESGGVGPGPGEGGHSAA